MSYDFYELNTLALCRNAASLNNKTHNRNANRVFRITKPLTLNFLSIRMSHLVVENSRPTRRQHSYYSIKEAKHFERMQVKWTCLRLKAK